MSIKCDGDKKEKYTRTIFIIFLFVPLSLIIFLHFFTIRIIKKKYDK